MVWCFSTRASVAEYTPGLGSTPELELELGSTPTPELELELELKPPELELELELIFWRLAGVGVGVGVETPGVGVGVDIQETCRSWSWSWNSRSWSWNWSWNSRELELELKFCKVFFIYTYIQVLFETHNCTHHIMPISKIVCLIGFLKFWSIRIMISLILFKQYNVRSFVHLDHRGIVLRVFAHML